MSKFRQQIDLAILDEPIGTEPEGDLKPYVIFTQLKEGGPYIYAGWLDAPDDTMALTLAKEHYGRDQVCVGIWAILRDNLHSSDGLYTLRKATAAPTTWHLFTQKRAGDVFLEAGTVQAQTPEEALELARAKPQAAKAHGVWITPEQHLVRTSPDELIWRHTDQTYRLARGYTKIVKAKWKKFRAEDAMREYEKEDLREEF